jgi:hypothetical protein
MDILALSLSLLMAVYFLVLWTIMNWREIAFIITTKKDKLVKKLREYNQS